MTTTYWGLLHGANEANTEVASLPATSAVPVLPATHTVPSGKRAKAPAAVPDVVAVGPGVVAPVLPGVRVVLPEVIEPLAGRHRAGVPLGQVNAGVLAEAPGQLHLLHLLHRRVRAGDDIVLRIVPLPDAVGEVVEDRVARPHQRLAQGHHAAVAEVVVEDPAADLHRRRAAVRAVQRVARRDRRGVGGRLPGGAWLLLALGVAVPHRVGGVGATQPLEPLVSQTA